MSTRVTLVLWDPTGRTEETWDRIAARLAERQGAAIVDVQVEEVEED